MSARDNRASSSGGTNKVFPKLGKLGGTIEESADIDKEHSPSQTLTVDSKQLQLRRLESYDGGLITQPGHEREILAAVLEVKVDLKLEVQRVNQKLAKIEDMLQTLINRMPSVGSPSQQTSPSQRIPPTIPSSTNGASCTAVSVSQSSSVIPKSGNNGAEPKPITSPTTSATTLVRESDQVASTSDRLASKSSDQQQPSQAHHHHHHHHHHHPIERQKESVSERLSGMCEYKSSTREINKELLERLAQVSSSRDDTSALGPLILRKRRSKSRGKGIAPLAPLATQSVSPTEATETTQMLESTEDRDVSAERVERKRPPPRPRDYL